jgi:holin-like protein
MKFIKVFLQIVVLYIFYIVGVWLSDRLHLPLPGSIIGLLLLWAVLLLKIFPLNWIESGANFILSYLPLFFIPATVGVMNYFHVFAGKGIFLILIVVLSTLITMAIAGYTSQYLAGREETEREELKSWKERL